MRSLKVIIFRDTDKPYTIIISSSLIVLVTFSIISLVSLLTFSVLGNMMLLGQAQAVVTAQVEQSAAGGPAKEGLQPTQEETGITEGEGAGASENTAETAAATEQPPAEEEENSVPFEDYAAPDSQFQTQLLSGPAVSGNSIRFTVRVEKIADKLGVNSSGKFVAALITTDGRIGPTFPADIQTNGDEIINPENGILFRISYRKDTGVEFNGVNLADYSALALFVFENEAPYRVLWRKIESIRD
jgi:hypothetical protein